MLCDKVNMIDKKADCELILGNSNPRFSGVTSTMLQNLEFQQRVMSVRVLGKHHLPDKSLAISFWQLAKLARNPRLDGRYRIFHARRNDEMLQALVLRWLFRAKFKIVFTSTAQRHHSRYTRWLLSKMDAVISTCGAAASYLESAPDKIIAHGIRQDTFHPIADKRQILSDLGLRGTTAIGIFGRVRKQKGVHVFVDACLNVFPDFPDAVAVIGGAINNSNEALVAELKEKIQAAGLQDRIRFLGEQPFDMVPRLFGAMDVVAALSQNEGFGLTVLEAMATGAAVIASEAGAWPEIITQGETGFVVPVNNVEVVAERIRWLLANPDMRRTMAEKGRDLVLQKYTVEREARELCDFFKTLQ